MEIIVITVLLLLNGVFAMYEIALVSARKSRLEEKSKSGSRGAKIALSLLKEPERILSAIQVGITLIGIVSGAYGGLAIAEDIEPLFQSVSFLSSYAHSLSIILVVGIITYFSLIIGELVPKTLALNNAESIAVLLSPFMRVIGKITYPVVSLLSISTKLVLKILHQETKENPPVTEEELRILLKQSSEHGIIEKEESQIINEVIRFGDKRASSLMTNRVEVIWLDINDSQDVLFKKAAGSKFSHLPVCDGAIDKIKGVVSVKELFYSYIANNKVVIKQLLTEPLFIPEQMLAIKVLELFRDTKKHFAIVINEFGSFEGIITLHDLTENIMGDLPNLNDKSQPEILKRDDSSYFVDGDVKLEDFTDYFNIISLFSSNEETAGVNTVAGYVMYKLNKLPKEGDYIQNRDFRFEVIDMDGNRIDKLLVADLRE